MSTSPNWRFINQGEAHGLALGVAERILRHKGAHIKLYGVPRGGVPVAYLVAGCLNTLVNTDNFAKVESNKLLGLVRSSANISVCDHPGDANFIVDDIVDSGRTRERYIGEKGLAPNQAFYALVDKTENPDPSWYVFPWERQPDDASETEPETFEDNVVRMLQAIGEDVTREGLVDTPRRVVKAWGEWFSGYQEDPGAQFKTFADGAEKQVGDEMVLVSNIPFYSHCEHHVAPIFGHVHVAYIPNKLILGLSKVVRVVRCFSRRLQVQERLTNQIADAFIEHLEPKGVGVIVKARHFCMESRGVNAPGTVTTTSALRGNLLLSQSARAEFIALADAAERKL